jgi:dihydroorotase
MTQLLIKGGRVLDPANEVDITGDVLVEDGRVVAVGTAVGAHGRAPLQTIDAKGMVVAPGFVDLHTHLREPGFEYKETVETGTRAAARGGFTTVCAMPNTEPAMDNRGTVDYVLQRAAEQGVVRVLPIGAVTKGREGKLLAELGELADAGCVGFSDDGNPVADASIMRHALEYASAFGLPVIDHCEDPQLAGGVMHEGWVSTRLGLKGIPAASEENMVSRDVALARQTGAHVHIAHLSTAGAVELVRRAKAEGVHVTAEVTPHHLALNHEAVMHSGKPDAALAYDTNAKMYPPLRGEEDVAACIEGLRDGTIDAIATDHAPHAVQEKLCEFDLALNGIVGLETALALSLGAGPSRGSGRTGLTLQRVVEALTVGPVRALGLDRREPGIGTLSEGAPADIVVFDPEREWTVVPEEFASKGRNTPVAGRTLKGAVVTTIYGGEVVHALEGAGV